MSLRWDAYNQNIKSMTLSLPLLAIIALVAAIAIFFYQSLHTREIALVTARQHCQRMGVQLLDQTIYCRRLRLVRSTTLPGIKRWYHFEFTSTGEERYPGTVEMLGNVPYAVQLAPHRFPAQPETPSHSTQRRDSVQ